MSLQHLLIGLMMLLRFQLKIYPAHCRLVIYRAFGHQNQIPFPLFNIALNVLHTILINLVAIVLALILILSIHHIITHLNQLLHILTLTGNPTPDFLISAVPSRLWDGFVLPDTTAFIIIPPCYFFLCPHISLRYPAFFLDLHFCF